MRRCKALTRAGNPCKAPAADRQGFCSVHRAPDRPKLVGRLGGLASGEARRKKRDQIRQRKVELEARKQARLDELARTEARVAALEKANRQRARARYAELEAWATKEHQRIWEENRDDRIAVLAQRGVLAREIRRLEALRDEIGRVDAETSVRRRSELLREEIPA